jgi:capsule polysaccharide export protein KpsE/RkpR
MNDIANSQRGIAVEPELDAALLEPGKPLLERRVARLHLLWNERRFLARTAAWGLVAATVIAFLIPRRYESTARLMPPDTQSMSGMGMLASLAGKVGGGNLATIGSEALGLKSSGALFVGILASRTVQDRLIERFDLRKVYWVSRWEDARKVLASRTDISEDHKSGIITLNITDRNPQRAAGLAQAYVEELNRLVVELTTSSAHRERVFLEERLRAVQQDLESAEKEFSQFSSKNTAIDIKEQGKAMVEAAATLEGELIAAQSELEGLKQIYTDNNVRVRAVRARTGELQHQLEKLGGKGENGSGAGSQPSDSLYPSLRKLPLLGVAYADLYRRTKVQEAVFETLTQEYELAKVQEAKEIPSVKVLDPANTPEKKSFPPRLLIMFLGTGLALSGAAAWVLGNARWVEMDPQDPRKQLTEEVLRTVGTPQSWFSRNGHGLPGVSWFRKHAGRGGSSDAEDRNS